MLHTLFTLDYEIHGNGEGCSYQLMVEPTRKLMNLFDEYGAKLTIMADAAEIQKFCDYKEQTGRDDYHYDKIVAQLQDAILRGHDVQLHLHTSYFNAHHEAGHWAQDWSEYNLATLPLQRLTEVVGIGKLALERLLKPVDPDYRCIAFRAANWSMSPSRNVVQALVSNGIKIDSSVFKYGQNAGLVNFDYRNAPSALIPWRVNENDICTLSENGKLLEVPIYCEKRWIGAFVTPQRIRRVYLSHLHRISRVNAGAEGERSATVEPKGKAHQILSSLGNRHAWKGDFNQCSGRQLIHALERAESTYECVENDLPFVLIGHSKLYTRFNEKSLRPFLGFVSSHPDRFGFTTFAALDLARDGAAGFRPPAIQQESRIPALVT